MERLEEIQQALKRLPLLQQLEAETWLRNLNSGPTIDGVAEAQVAYAVDDLPFMTLDEYFQFEEKSPVRHEFVNGFVFAMTGASLAHVRVTRNLVIALGNRLQRGPCEVFATDAKVLIRRDATKISYYPDVIVDCRPEARGENFVQSPKLIVEVLSPSTHLTDRREKLQNYALIESVEEYVLAAQDEYKMKIYRRADGWRPRVCAGAEGAVEFRSIELTVPLSELYRDVLAE